MIITCLVWAERLLALAILFQTIELMQLRFIWSDQGIWRWQTLRKAYEDHPPFLRSLFDRLLSEQNFQYLLWVRLACCVGVWFVFPYSLLMGVLFFSTWLIAIRWRGIFNGGSDSMTALIAFALWIAQSFSLHFWVVKACLAYIAVQITASYFIAGYSKLKSAEWRSGVALSIFFKTPRYDSPPEWAKKAMSDPMISKVVSYGVIGFQLSFPLAWSSPTLCGIYILAAFGFHLLNFWIFGLNRFVFAWLAGYPALYFWSHR